MILRIAKKLAENPVENSELNKLMKEYTDDIKLIDTDGDYNIYSIPDGITYNF